MNLLEARAAAPPEGDPRWPDGVGLDRTARETAIPPERLPDDPQATGHFAAPVRVTLQPLERGCGVAAPGGLKGQPQSKGQRFFERHEAAVRGARRRGGDEQRPH